MEEDQDVRLEFVASVEIDAHRIVRFVQELQGIPADAWCEVQNVWSKPEQAGGKDKLLHTVATTAQMRCERRAADFLCSHFSNQVRHVSQGELMLVRCRRVFNRSLPTATSPKRTQPSKPPRLQHEASTRCAAVVSGKTDEKRSPAVSRTTMIDLLDCLGDQIVDVLDAFQAHAVQGNPNSQLTMIGLIQALSQLRKTEWSIKDNTQPLRTLSDANTRKTVSKDPSKDRLAVEKVRHLLARLIARGVVSVTSLPATNETPFLTYTDFIAFYVAFMSSSAAESGGYAAKASYGSSVAMK